MIPSNKECNSFITGYDSHIIGDDHIAIHAKNRIIIEALTKTDYLSPWYIYFIYNKYIYI